MDESTSKPEAPQQESPLREGGATMLAQTTSFVYVNSTEVVTNNWDVRIALGERLPNGTTQFRQGIVMSFQHFKAFVEVLTKQLGRLEEAMGEISYVPVNPDAMKRDKD